ncbi:hypothetical protein PVL29_008698 [Vitis rotundifolia]|uniref:Uncharacterized protein n=1 Tax=Vitis rotundifolia TaxID=103349 RepID=A0AA39DUI8_VITRO|nr:hypothetical protein PVL29_008698 [Vitis rotundifolia]
MEDQAAMKAIVPLPTKKLSKKRGPMSLLKAALYMVRRNHSKKKAPVAVEVASNAMKLVGSMRPLHLQESNPPPPPCIHLSISMDNFQDVSPPPISPSAASSSGSSNDCMSRYASAQNLQELGRSDDDDDAVWGDGGDEMIDIKAKEFIAQFYEQMRLERLDSFKRATD